MFGVLDLEHILLTIGRRQRNGVIYKFRVHVLDLPPFDVFFQ
jgi:hypothetical protein